MVILYVFAAFIISVLYYRKNIPEIGRWNRFLLISLRTISIFIVFILLFNPILTFLSRKEHKPEIVFLIDDSESMELQHDGATKKEFLTPTMNELKKRLERKNYAVQSYSFANGLQGETYATNLSKTFQELSRKNVLERTDTIFLFSDGWFHDDDITAIQKLAIPVYTLLTKSKETKFDLEIASFTHNNTAYLNESNPIAVSISAHQYEGKANLQLFDDKKMVAEKEVDFSQSSYQQIQFEHQFGYTGLHKLKAEITAADSPEAFTKNNTKSSAIQVLKDKMQALVLTDKLNWDATFLQRSIRNNERWDVTFMYQKRNQWMQQNTTTTLEEHLSKADVILVIRTDKLHFSSAERELIKKYCDLGGGFFYQGFPESSLREILPYQGNILARDFTAKFSITETGKKYQTLSIPSAQLDVIPPVPYAYVNPTMQSQILATFFNEENSPAILYQTYGKGKVLLLPFLDLWKWQMRQSENAYETFISDVVSWLSNQNSETFFATSDHLMYRQGDAVAISLTAYDETLSPRFDVQAQISLNKDSQEIFTDYLVQREETYSVTIPDLTAGDYHYLIQDEKTGRKAEGDFTVSTEDPENYDIGFNNSLLSFLAKETLGTAFYDTEELSFSSAESTVEIKRIELPLYRKWYLIVLFILAFCSELFFRKRWGLL